MEYFKSLKSVLGAPQDDQQPTAAETVRTFNSNPLTLYHSAFKSNRHFYIKIKPLLLILASLLKINDKSFYCKI